MKKILLSTIALMMSVAMMAIGLGDGSSKANALDFDWTTDNVHDATEALWYNVSLAPVNAANEPAVVLYLTNLTDEEATVNVTVSIASAQRTVTYTIAARDYYRLDIPVDQYREFITLDEISLMIKSNVKLSLGAKVYVTTVDGSYGIRGFVTDAMKDLEYSYFYTCGPEPMLKAIYDKSETSGQFSFEERMGCGFGACMGCSCKTVTGYKRICKDGPILEKEEILWEK